MITARAFERGLATLLQYPPGQIDKRTRALREAGLLPVGARGFSTPPVTAVEAALILCCLAPLRAEHARTTGLRILNLEFVPVPGAAPELLRAPDGRQARLGEVIGTMLLGRYELAWDRLEIGSDGTYAVLHSSEPSLPPRLLFAPDAKALGKEVADRAAYDLRSDVGIGHQFRISRAMVAFLATWLGEPTPDIVFKLEAHAAMISLGSRRLEDVDQMIAELSTRSPQSQGV